MSVYEKASTVGDARVPDEAAGTYQGLVTSFSPFEESVGFNNSPGKTRAA